MRYTIYGIRVIITNTYVNSMLPGVRFNQNKDTETLDKTLKNVITSILTTTYHYMLWFKSTKGYMCNLLSPIMLEGV